MRPIVAFQDGKAGVANALYLVWLLALVLIPVLISELLYSAFQ
jgi:hypothetical protein